MEDIENKKMRTDFDFGFETGVRRMATKVRRFILDNANLSGGALIKVGDVEKLQEKILKYWEAMTNE